jgi:hypothetical protein
MGLLLPMLQLRVMLLLGHMSVSVTVYPFLVIVDIHRHLRRGVVHVEAILQRHIDVSRS